ncbi:MAG: formylglycine-generating enzyme family protein [Pyrinomonadaceae bacterium]|nr:formylglycine-generating enzyme family protein [Pyrinomonadaceae bacterium]
MNINEEKKDNLEIVVAVSLLAILILLAGDVAVFGQVTGLGKVKKNSIGMELVEIPSGQSFLIGSPESEEWRDKDEGPQKKVTIAKSFFMGKYEVTQEQWEVIMGSNPSNNRDCARCPVEQVSWEDAQEFIKKLNAKNNGYVYRLPTEAEWEYAARAGKKTVFTSGNTMSFKEANFDSRYPYGGASKGKYHVKTIEVGSYKANAWGLYDTHGNVGEWVQDKYTSAGYQDLPTDGSVNTAGDGYKRVYRGGSWRSNSRYLRSANRSWKNQRDRSREVGFRIVATRDVKR